MPLFLPLDVFYIPALAALFLLLFYSMWKRRINEETLHVFLFVFVIFSLIFHQQLRVAAKDQITLQRLQSERDMLERVMTDNGFTFRRGELGALLIEHPK